MPAITITLAQLDALGPCVRRRDEMAAALDWSTPVDAARAVAAGATLDDIVWVASALADPDVDRRLRLWLSDCAARVLHIFERERPTDMRPRDAVLAARRYARGEIDAAARDAARAAAWAAWAAARAARDAAMAAGAAGTAGTAARAAARDAAGDAAWAAWAAGAARAAWAAAGAARDAAGAAAGAAARDAARDAEELWQLHRLVAWLLADEPEDWPLPTPLTQDAAA